MCGTRIRAALLAAAVAVALPMAPAAAQQQDVRPLLDRMERLEREITTLQRQVYRGGAVQGQPAPQGQAFSEMPGDLAGRLQVRMSELERLVQELTGRVEQTQFQTRQVSERLDQFIKDADFRFNQLEGNAPVAAAGDAATTEIPAAATASATGAGMAAVPPGAGTGQGVLGVMPSGNGATSGAVTQPAAVAALPSGGSAKDQYDHAFGLLRKGDYANAEVALSAFLKANPKHELAGNAQYWLGETHYVRGDLQKAAVAFLDGYRTYPKNSKAPDNLLKLGIAMGRLNQKAEACAALGRLISEYPQAPDVIKRRATAEREQLVCK
ncbi:MAG: tol-pal system protein YbgF [Rhodospirillaceae bacterium]